MYSELFESKESYYLANRDGSFSEVAGTKLSNGLFAHKKDSNFLLWCISDIKSGLSVETKLKTLKDCKDFVANMTEEEREKIDNIRKTSGYLDLCAKLEIAKNKVRESFNFNEAYDELNKEQDQLLLL